MSSSVYDVANYILQKTGRMTTMKLQKLVYYCQAWSLAWDDVPLFDEDFQAWANGPVCPELFTSHKGLFSIDSNFYEKKAKNKFNKTEIETMNAVLKFYADKSPHWLSELTHKEHPWKLAREGCDPGEPCDKIITKNSMQSYYGGL